MNRYLSWYPWMCGNCAKKEVFPIIQDYTVEYWNGKKVDLTISNFEVPTCKNCGNKQFGLKQCDEINEVCSRM